LGDLLVHWLCVGCVLVNLVDLREECLRELGQVAEELAVGLLQSAAGDGCLIFSFCFFDLLL
jgi:hypothetical protein